MSDPIVEIVVELTLPPELNVDYGDVAVPGYTPVKGVDYFDGGKGDKGDKGDKGETGSASSVAGPGGSKGDKGDQGSPTTWSGLPDKPTLGTAAASATGDFATSTQGGKADTAVQPGALGTAAAQNTSAFDTAGAAATALASATTKALAYALALG